MYSFKNPNFMRASKGVSCCRTNDNPSWPRANTIFLPLVEVSAYGGILGPGELHILPYTFPSSLDNSALMSAGFVVIKPLENCLHISFSSAKSFSISARSSHTHYFIKHRDLGVSPIVFSHSKAKMSMSITRGKTYTSPTYMWNADDFLAQGATGRVYMGYNKVCISSTCSYK